MSPGFPCDYHDHPDYYFYHLGGYSDHPLDTGDFPDHPGNHPDSPIYHPYHLGDYFDKLQVKLIVGEREWCVTLPLDGG